MTMHAGRLTLISSLVFAAGTLLPHQGSAQEPSTRSSTTVAYWQFENGTSGEVASGTDTILDSSGHGLDGTPYGDPVYTLEANPVSEYALAFNGSSSRVYIPDDPQFFLNSLTLEAYITIYSTPQPEGQIVFRGDDRDGLDPYNLEIEIGGYLHFKIFNDANDYSDLATSFPLPFNQQLHVAGTLDADTGEQNLYVNGVLVASRITAIRPIRKLDSSQIPGIGIGNVQSATDSEYFDGTISDVRISNIALSPSEFLPPIKHQP